MSDLSYYQEVAMGELALDVQRCVKLGWEFRFESGERKFDNAIMYAKKGEQEVSGNVEGIFTQIYRIEYPENF